MDEPLDTQPRPPQSDDPELQGILDAFYAPSWNRYARDAVDAALRRADDVRPLLRAVLEDVVARPHAYAGDDSPIAPLYAIMLLGYFKDVAAHPVVVALSRLPGDLPDDILGDTLTDGLGTILCETCGEDLGQIKTLVEDPEANEYARSAGMHALTYAAVDGSVPRDVVMSYFRELLERDDPPAGDVFWDYVVSAACDLYPEPLMPLIEAGYESGKIENSGFIPLSSVRDVMERGLDDALSHTRYFLDSRRPADFHERMAWWHCFQPDRTEPHGRGPGRSIPPPGVRAQHTKAEKNARKRKRKLARTARKKGRR